MKERDLAPDLISEPYFEGSKITVSSEESGTREMGPLFPFIVSGGTNTERLYFTHLTDITKYKFNIKPKYFADESDYTEKFPIRIREILAKNADAKIFCVFDWDTVFGDKSEDQKLKRKHDDFIIQFDKEIARGILTICPSMPCIEYWFLLHFEDYKDLLKNYAQVSNRLAPHIKPYFDDSSKALKKLLKSEKYLQDSSWVQKLCADGKLELAISRAENNIRDGEARNDLNNHSYTYVYKLFK